MPDKPEGKNSCSVLLSRVFMSPFLTDTEVQQIIAEEALSNNNELLSSLLFRL
jgi:hypothetical protein